MKMMNCEKDIDGWIKAELGANFVRPVVLGEETPEESLLEEGYSEESVRITIYLTTLIKLVGISTSEFRKFKR